MPRKASTSVYLEPATLERLRRLQQPQPAGERSGPAAAVPPTDGK